MVQACSDAESRPSPGPIGVSVLTREALPTPYGRRGAVVLLRGRLSQGGGLMPRWMVWITWSAALLIGPVAWALGPPIASASSPHLTVVSVDATHSTSPALSAATTPRAPATVPVMSPPCALAWDPLPPHPDGCPWPDLAYHVYLKRATDPTYPRVPTITVDAPATRVACAALNLRHNRVYRAVVRARATGLPESGSSNEV